MSRAYFTLSTARQRALAIRSIEKAPDGWTVEMREPRRTDAQNAALWSLLGQITKQRPSHGHVANMTAEAWKAVFMQALGREGVFLPTLAGDGVFPMGFRSSHLTKAEMSGLIEVILCWCAENDITIRHFDPEPVKDEVAA